MRRILAVALSLALHAGSAAAQDVKVALIAGRTGPLDAYARQTEAGFMLGLDYLTKGTMTVGGRRIDVLVRDDEGRPDLARTLLEQAYRDDGAAIAVGSTSSASTLAMLPVAAERKRILVVEPAVADSITGDRGNRYVFRTARNSTQDALATAVVLGRDAMSIATLAQDTPFGRDGVAALKAALAASGSRAAVVAEDYAPPELADVAQPARRLIEALKERPGRRVLAVIWAGSQPLEQVADLDPERSGVELAPGGNILSAMRPYRRYPGMEGATNYHWTFPANPMNDWLVGEHRRRFGGPPDFFTAGGMAAASAVVTALERAGSSDPEALVATMEGMTFETPKGPMTFRREDHQALQAMYHYRVRAEGQDEDELLTLVREIPPSEMPLPIRPAR